VQQRPLTADSTAEAPAGSAESYGDADIFLLLRELDREEAQVDLGAGERSAGRNPILRDAWSRLELESTRVHSR
jgi:hypothetical protein